MGGFREYVASFRSEPGAEITPVDNPLEIVAEDRDGKHAQGELLFGSVGTTEITMTLLLDAALIALPVNRTLTFAGRFEGNAMRELGVELESEIGVDPLPEWDFNGETITVEKSFANAGFDVFNVGFRSQFPSPSSGQWDTSQLHGLMAQFAQEPIDRKSWNLHLLLLQESTLAGLLGVMFDSGEADVNQLPRQGAAVFQRPIKTRPDWPRKLIQTTVHELGHALNLAHRFERPVGRADSTSFMNYDWKYLGGMNADRFWREFDFTFDADEVAFLRHGPLANRRRCRINRVSHAQIDDIIAVEPLFGFHLVDHTKKIWRQLLHTLCELNLMLLCHGFLLAEHLFKKSPERLGQRLKKATAAFLQSVALSLHSVFSRLLSLTAAARRDRIRRGGGIDVIYRSHFNTAHSRRLSDFVWHWLFPSIFLV